MINITNKTFTIYNTLPGANESNPVYGIRKVIKSCSASQGLQTVLRNNTTSSVNKTTVISKDFSYLPPHEYYASEKKESHYTIAPGDFIVFDEVEDVVTNSKEFTELKNKYKLIGIVVDTAQAYLNGLPTDNIQAVST